MQILKTKDKLHVNYSSVAVDKEKNTTLQTMKHQKLYMFSVNVRRIDWQVLNVTLPAHLGHLRLYTYSYYY